VSDRYTLSKAEQLAEMLREVGFLFDEASEARLKPRYNISPMQDVPVVFDDAPKKLSYARWGVVPSWAKDANVAPLAHARAETVTTKQAYSFAFQRRRCLIPADGFYEWKTVGPGKVPYYFTLSDSRLFWFAGLWDERRSPSGEPIRSCLIITTTPNGVVAPVHDRMPVILLPERECAWISAATPVPALQSFLVPYPSHGLRSHAVPPLVNKVTNDGPALIEPAKKGDTFRLEP
jgi:putative SOS response-associated peptidase YedK